MQASQTQILVDMLSHVGLSLSSSTTGGLAVSPASLLTDDLRTLIRTSKAALIEWVKAGSDHAYKVDKTVSNIGTIRPPGLSPKLLAASLALDASIIAASSLPGNDSGACGGLLSTAMNGSERVLAKPII